MIVSRRGYLGFMETEVLYHVPNIVGRDCHKLLRRFRNDG